jgi:menaquinol-cytochrome c reductase iron-sulfur subunit
MENRGVPGSAVVDGSRRTFLQAIIWFFSAAIGLALAIPFVAAILGSSRRKAKPSFADVAAVDSLPVEEPVDLMYASLTKDAFIHRQAMHHIWAIRTSASAVTVFSPICPHLGCSYDWDPRTRRFMCPCHGSVYTITGKVVAGPAPRPLDTLPTEVRGGRLLVAWEQFKPGIAQKIVI